VKIPTRAATLVAAFALAPAAVSSAADLPGVFALVNAKVVPAPGRTIDKGTIVIRDGIVAAVGPTGAVTVPADATEIDLAGKTVYAGLIDPYVTLGRLAGKKERPAEDDLAAGRPRPTPSPTPEAAGNATPSRG